MTDWSQCAAIESVPGKASGAWIFKGSRVQGGDLFNNLASGASIEEVM